MSDRADKTVTVPGFALNAVAAGLRQEENALAQRAAYSVLPTEEQRAILLDRVIRLRALAKEISGDE